MQLCIAGKWYFSEPPYYLFYRANELYSSSLEDNYNSIISDDYRAIDLSQMRFEKYAFSDCCTQE